VGTVRTALFNWLYARRHGGTFILRLDDVAFGITHVIRGDDHVTNSAAQIHRLMLALTARETRPEMARLLPLIGRAKASARLSGQRA
jgi:glutamyl/glutaminyl-tRNA synthetase